MTPVAGGEERVREGGTAEGTGEWFGVSFIGSVLEEPQETEEGTSPAQTFSSLMNSQSLLK